MFTVLQRSTSTRLTWRKPLHRFRHALIGAALTAALVGCTGTEIPSVDTDQDGITDSLDLCANTPLDETVNTDGCAPSQRDSDADGVNDASDQCPMTPAGSMVDQDGCELEPPTFPPTPPAATGQSLYQAQCALCHGQSGNDPRQPIAFALYPRKAQMAGVITSTMPKQAPNDCDSDCAALVTDYLWQINNLTEAPEAPIQPIAEHAHNGAGWIEAEAYHRYFNATPNSNDGNCTNNSAFGQGVDLNRTFGNEPAGCYVGFIEPGEWLEYDLAVTYAGVFDMALRIASKDPNKTLEVFIDGVSQGTVTAPAKGWGVYENITLNNIRMNEGGHVLRIAMTTGGLDLNNFEITQTLTQPSNINDLSGSEIHGLICESCHGVTGSEGTAAYAGISFTDEFGDLKYTKASLTAKIATDMPFRDPAYCDSTCAQKVTEYLWAANQLDKITPINCTNDGAAVQQNSPIRLLTRSQLAELYSRAFSPLNITEAELAALLPADVAVAGFSNNAGVAAGPQSFSEIMRAAEFIATRASETPAVLLDNCTLGNNTCVQNFIANTSQTLFKRATTTAEKTRLFDVFSTVKQTNTNRTAFKALIMAMLLDVQTLYQAEVAVSQRQMLSTSELLSKLSFLILNRAPDSGLIDQVAQSGLTNRDAVKTLAEQLLAHPDAQNGLSHFYHGWLHLNDFGDFNVTANNRQITLSNNGLVAELERFVNYLTLETDGTFADLMTDNTAFIHPDYSPLYGLDLHGSDIQQIALTGRSGLLTRSAYLRSGNNEQDATSITLRGLKVRERILCQHIEPPSAEVQNQFPEHDIASNALSPIEFFTQVHLSVEGCAGCHQFIDPIGFAFEAYDGFGLNRSHYADGNPVDFTGKTYIQTMTGQASDIPGEFNDVNALAAKLATSERAQSCFVKQWYRNAFTRNISREDRCAFENLYSEFENSGFSLKALILAIATSDAFIYRNPD